MAVTIQHGTIQMTAQGDAVSGRPGIPPGSNLNPDGSWTVNPATLVTNLQQRVNSITIDPSGTSWAVTLKNQNGSIVWSGSGNTQTSFFVAGIWDFNGIVLSTATNVSRISLAFDYIEW